MEKRQLLERRPFMICTSAESAANYFVLLEYIVDVIVIAPTIMPDKYPTSIVESIVSFETFSPTKRIKVNNSASRKSQEINKTNIWL